MQKKTRIMLSTVMAAALAGCGGGGGGTYVGEAPAIETEALVVSGTAATGLAIANAPVSIVCKDGVASTHTAGDGSFKLVLPAAAVAPCALQATLPDATTLHSLVPAGASGSVIANITSLTQLQLAAATGMSPEALFEAFSTAAPAGLTTEALAEAFARVAEAVKGIIDLSGVDPLTAPLVAATGPGGSGNALDQLLDALNAELAGLGVPLDDLVVAFAANPTTNAPVQWLLQPAAASCSTMRSASYVLVGGGPDAAVKFDASTMMLDFPGMESMPVTAGEEACTFDLPALSGSVVATSTGVAIVSGAGAMQVMIPAQDLPKSLLAGSWNLLGFEAEPGSTAQHSMIQLTFDEAGDFVSGAECEAGVCDAWSAEDAMTVTKNDDGSFTLRDGGGETRTMLFTNIKGEPAMFALNEFGLMFGAKAQPEVLPAVGSVTNSLDFFIEPDGSTSAFDANRATVAAVDADTMSYTRTDRFSGGSAQPDDAWKLNAPYTGLRYRAAGNGASEIAAMTVPGAGMTVGHFTLGGGVQRFLISTPMPVAMP